MNRRGEHPKVLDRVGLLVNKRLGMAEVPFNQSSDDLDSNTDPSGPKAHSHPVNQSYRAPPSGDTTPSKRVQTLAWAARARLQAGSYGFGTPIWSQRGRPTPCKQSPRRRLESSENHEPEPGRDRLKEDCGYARGIKLRDGRDRQCQPRDQRDEGRRSSVARAYQTGQCPRHQASAEQEQQ